MFCKICGVTEPQQAAMIAQLSPSAIGMIGVPHTARYVSPPTMAAIAQTIQGVNPHIHRVGVFLDPDWEELCQCLSIADLNGIQLHGSEPPELGDRLKAAFPHLLIIKALRIAQPQDLSQADQYAGRVDYLLLDAYDPKLAGGTGKMLDTAWLQNFAPPYPWLLAGGLTPDNVQAALRNTFPVGVDVSSGVERSPGIKDLERVAQFIRAIRTDHPQ